MTLTRAGLRAILKLIVIMVALGIFLALVPTLARCQYLTLTGTLQASNGLPAVNDTLSFTPSQFGFIAGTGVFVNTTTFCATSVDGSVVGITNPLVATVNTAMYVGGTLPAANYYVQVAWYTAAGTLTLVSPESTAQLTLTGNLQVAPPVGGLPAGVLGYKVYIGTSRGAETLQATVVGYGTYLQSIPLVTGATPPATNTTLCKQVANDAIWPVGTGYTTSMVDPSGNTFPGYPMLWQLLGPNTTINLSNGLPYYHGIVTFPVPILASPYNHGLQSISGPLSLGSYYVIANGGFGAGVLSPLWGLDLEGSGPFSLGNAKGWLINGAGGSSGQAPCSDGTSIDLFCNFVPLSTTFYYQTMQANAVDQTQRLKLNFSSDFTLTDSASPSRTNVAPLSVGTPGTYAYPSSVTTDPKGRVTAITAGAAVSRTCGGSGCYSIDSAGTITEWVNTGALPDNTTATITLPHAIPTAIMAIQCTDNGGRVQTGNEFALGANVVGLSAPFSTFFVLGSATGLNGYCTVTGY